MTASRLLPALILLTACSTPALARDDRCDDANSTYEMNICADRDFSRADKALNVAYKRAMAEASERDVEKPHSAAEYRAALRESQRKWIALRDADCKGLTAQEWSGGTGTTSAILGCMTSMTLARTKDLKERFSER